jgi:hypothetical protein
LRLRGRRVEVTRRREGSNAIAPAIVPRYGWCGRVLGRWALDAGRRIRGPLTAVRRDCLSCREGEGKIAGYLASSRPIVEASCRERAPRQPQVVEAGDLQERMASAPCSECVQRGLRNETIGVKWRREVVRSGKRGENRAVGRLDVVRSESGESRAGDDGFARPGSTPSSATLRRLPL